MTTKHVKGEDSPLFADLSTEALAKAEVGP